MASRYIIDINSNDDLVTVIKKCNANFKNIISQQMKQRQIDEQDSTDDVEEIIADAVGEATDSLIRRIDAEATLRSNKDLDLENAINTVSRNFDNYTKTEDLVGVEGAYMTFGTENPSTIYGGQWSSVGNLQIGAEQLNVWKRIS